jgi:preprotein translocase subunit SecG
MFTVLLVIHVLVTLALIGVVLIQRSEGGGLGIGGGQGMGSFMTGRGTANLLTRTTAILATVFLGLSLVLALMTRHLQRADHHRAHTGTRNAGGACQARRSRHALSATPLRHITRLGFPQTGMTLYEERP